MQYDHTIARIQATFDCFFRNGKYHVSLAIVPIHILTQLEPIR